MAPLILHHGLQSLRLGLRLILSLTFLIRLFVVTLRGRPGDGEFCSTLPVVLKCLTMFQTLVLGSRSLFAIAPVDSPCLCNVMIFWRNTKHFVIFEGTKILTWFSADRHSWVWPISCPSQKCGKIQITSYRTRNVAFQYIWRTLYTRVSLFLRTLEHS